MPTDGSTVDATPTTCVIGGMSYAAGAPDPTNACQSCQPTISTSAWVDVVDGTACGAGKICRVGACASGCYVDGVYFVDGSPDPNDPCETCQAAMSSSTWTGLQDGAACGNGQVCSGGMCGSQCDIGGTIYPPQGPNPTNACQICQPGRTTAGWTNLSDGTSCASDAVCSGGVCTSSCFIGGAIIAPAVTNPANACQSCQPSTSTTAWTTVSDGTTCASGQVCHAGSCGSGCFISGILYSSGTVNPANACQSCQPAASTTFWSNINNGTSCGAGDICNNGLCASGCFLSGTVWGAGAPNPANNCQSCQPTTSTTAWSNIPDGTGCGAGEVCSSGGCGAGCFIGSTVYGAGASNPANNCQTCQPVTSTTAWSNIPNGSSCAQGEVCLAGACGAGCFIGGLVYASGIVNPANDCQSCQPATSTTTWSNISDGSSCSAGEVCSAGSCTAGCFIGGTVYTSGTIDPANACQSCQPSTSTTAWSNVANGTGCASGEVCNAGTCAPDCFISGTLYSSGTLDPANACLSCQPSTSTTAWSDVTYGNGCGSGKVCNAGACAAGCFIGGTVYASGALNPSNSCQECQPAASTTAWTTLANGTGCGSGEVCNSGSCGSGCFISGVSYPTGALNPADACQSCQPGTSTTAWTGLSDGTSCGSGEVCKSASCISGCFIAGTVYTSGTVDPANACLSCQPATSTTAWSNIANGASCGSGEVCKTGSCISGCFIGGTVYTSGTVDPANACLSCQPATSTTAWSDVANGTVCSTGRCWTGTCDAPPSWTGVSVTASALNCTYTNKLYIAWGTPSDASGITHYTISGINVGLVNNYTYTGLAQDTSYCFTVVAYDNAGNSSTSGTACGTTDASFASVLAPWFNSTCSGCHTGSGSSACSGFAYPTWTWANTVNNASCFCSGDRILAGNPGASVLYNAICTPGGACIGTMPPSGQVVSNCAAISTWISQGACNN